VRRGIVGYFAFRRGGEKQNDITLRVERHLNQLRYFVKTYTGLLFSLRSLRICLPYEIHVNEEQSEFHWGGEKNYSAFCPLLALWNACPMKFIFVFIPSGRSLFLWGPLLSDYCLLTFVL